MPEIVQDDFKNPEVGSLVIDQKDFGLRDECSTIDRGAFFVHVSVQVARGHQWFSWRNPGRGFPCSLPDRAPNRPSKVPAYQRGAEGRYHDTPDGER